MQKYILHLIVTIKDSDDMWDEDKSKRQSHRSTLHENGTCLTGIDRVESEYPEDQVSQATWTD